MAEKNFITFVEDLTNDTGALRLTFSQKIKSVGLTEGQLMKYFNEANYKGITEDDCKKIIATVNAIGKAQAGDIVLQY